MPFGKIAAAAAAGLLTCFAGLSPGALWRESSDTASDTAGARPRVGSTQPSQENDRETRRGTAVGAGISLQFGGAMVTGFAPEAAVGEMTAGGPVFVTTGTGGLTFREGATSGGQPFSTLETPIPPRRYVGAAPAPAPSLGTVACWRGWMGPVPLCWAVVTRPTTQLGPPQLFSLMLTARKRSSKPRLALEAVPSLLLGVAIPGRTVAARVVQGRGCGTLISSPTSNSRIVVGHLGPSRVEEPIVNSREKAIRSFFPRCRLRNGKQRKQPYI